MEELKNSQEIKFELPDKELTARIQGHGVVLVCKTDSHLFDEELYATTITPNEFYSLKRALKFGLPA